MIWLLIYFPPNHIVNLVKPLFWISLALCLQRGSHSIRFLVSRLLGNSSCSPWCRRFEREEEQKECGIFSVPLPLFFSLSLALASLHLPGTGPWAGLGASEGSRLRPCSWEITVCRPVLDMGRPECVFLSFLIDERETSTCCSNYLCIHCCSLRVSWPQTLAYRGYVPMSWAAWPGLRFTALTIFKCSIEHIYAVVQQSPRTFSVLQNWNCVPSKHQFPLPQPLTPIFCFSNVDYFGYVV